MLDIKKNEIMLGRVVENRLVIESREYTYKEVDINAPRYMMLRISFFTE